MNVVNGYSDDQIARDFKISWQERTAIDLDSGKKYERCRGLKGFSGKRMKALE